MNSLSKWKRIGLCVMTIILIVGTVIFLFFLSKKRALTASVIQNSDALTDISYSDSDIITYDDVTYEKKDNMLTFLMLGIDDWEIADEAVDGLSGGQSDALFLAVMDQDEKKIYLVAINRNAMVLLDLYDEDGNYLGQGYGQITLQHAYGDGLNLSCERTANTVSRLFYQIPINRYVSLNMGAISMLNNLAGGVDLVSMADFDEPGFSVKAGETVHLQGMQAYYYLKYRDTNVFNSASDRMERQKQYISILADNLIQKTREDIRFPFSLYDTISSYMVTDFDKSEMLYMALKLIGYSADDIEILSVPGETVMGDEFEEFYVDNDAFYRMFLDIYYRSVDE